MTNGSDPDRRDRGDRPSRLSRPDRGDRLNRHDRPSRQDRPSRPRGLRGKNLRALLVLLTFGVAARPVAAQEGEFVVPIEVTVTDGRAPRSDLVDARLGGDGSLLALDGVVLMRPLRLMAVPEALTDLEDRDWLEPADLEEAGFRLEWDPAFLTAAITVPPEVQPVQSISGRGSRSIMPGEVVEASRISGSLPFFLSLQQTASGGTLLDPEDRQDRMDIEVLPALNVAGTVFSGRANTQFLPEQVLLETWEAAISRDFFGSTRVTVGTTRIDSFGFQTSDTLFGGGVEHRAGIGGTPVRNGRFQTSFDVETESVVEIYLNERLLRTERLAPGRYRLSELPLVPGLNDVRLVIVDAFGSEREIVDRLSHASGLLPRRETEFGVAAGTVGDSLDVVIGRGYLRRGLTGDITGVIYGEGTADDQMAGLSLTAPSPLGVLTLGGAGVSTSGATSDVTPATPDTTSTSPAPPSSSQRLEYAAELAWRYSLPSMRYVPTLGATAVYRSSAFFAPGTLPGARPSRVAPWIIGATISQALPRNTSLVVGGRYTVDASGGDDVASAFSYFGAQIGRGVSLRASLNVDDVTGDPDLRGRITVTVGVGRGRYRSSFSTPDETLGLSMNQNFDVREVSGNGGVAVETIDLREGEVGSVSANLRVANPRAEVAGAVRVAPGSALVGDGADRGEARLRLGSGLYFADGVVGVGRPTTGSFAVIGAAPGMPPGPILVNPRGDGAEARSGWLGAAVLSTVPDYYEKPIRVELPDLPIDYAMEWSEIVYASAYRSGLGLRVGGGRLLYGTGRLVAEDGEPVALRLVRVVRAGETVYTGYTDESGTFLIYDLVPGNYSLRLGELGPWARFSLTPDQEPPVDLGELTVGVR
jgi:hypothetical protein